MNDCPGLRVSELESGMATVTRTEDFFDSLPAVQQAFRFTKIISTEGEDQDRDNEGKPKIDPTLDFDEFRLFLMILRQYYSYCQVVSTVQLQIFVQIIQKEFNVNMQKDHYFFQNLPLGLLFYENKQT